ncbi:hypothetical protein LGH82_19120 [Mesorhizobium sp. PAMC28654]|uniref:hypothetical protein n=1 Tax=Mesorhizobium sp. PAMC28654 TaxID=2880934 RepID=UPI001D09CD13|nr:hypothetical protein [Mesorhizobium sp. PAMC28654]UDL87301.1 hypothetical protein LGH82_19120 [Mesorhizobium sp. PAMC28654]
MVAQACLVHLNLLGESELASNWGDPMNFVATKELKDQIDDLHRGLHFTLEALVNQKDYRRSEELLREMDFYLTRMVNETKVTRLR